MSTSLMHHNYIMHPISSSQKENILSLASNGHSTCHIASSLGVSQSTVSRVLKDLLPNRNIPLSGCPSKLSPTSQHSIVTQITMGKVANAVQATQHINSIISTPVSSDSQKNPQETLIQGCDKEEKAIALCSSQKEAVGLCFKVQELDCGGLEEGDLVR